MTKTCNVCFVLKPISEFRKGHNQCKACAKIKATCEHNRQRCKCKECGGSQICEHNRERSKCKDCGGSSICEHNRERSTCKECGGSQICEHKRQRSKCKECGGSSICEHQKRRYSCPTCSPNSNAFCHGCPQKTLVFKRNNYLCQYCRPDGSARQRTREYKIKAFLEKSGYTFIHNRAVNTTNLCQAFRPDFLFDCTSFYLIVECDEDAHRQYDPGCERAREFAIRDFLNRPCVFIRFNPDRYLGPDGKNIDVRNRYPVLKRTIDFYLENGFDGIDLFVEYMFY